MKAMSNYTAAAVLAFIFVLGVFIGVGADRWYVKRNFHDFARSQFMGEVERHGPPIFFHGANKPPRHDDAEFKQRVMKKFVDRLALSDEQARAIGTLLESNRGLMDGKRDLFFREIRGVMERTDSEIMKLLDEKQKAEFKKMIAEKMARGDRPAGDPGMDNPPREASRPGPPDDGPRRGVLSGGKLK